MLETQQSPGGHVPHIKRTLPFIDKFRERRFKKKYKDEICEVLRLFRDRPHEVYDLVGLYVIMLKEHGWPLKKTHKIFDICVFCQFVSGFNPDLN